AEVVAAGDVERPPVVAAECEVGGGGRPVHDAAELLAGRVHDPDPAGAAAIDIALDIDLHAVGHARLRPTQIGEHPVGVLCQHAARQQLEGPDVAATCVVDVEDAL